MIVPGTIADIDLSMADGLVAYRLRISRRGLPFRIVQAVHRLPVRARYQVPVSVHGELNRVMPEKINIACR
jgi:hypothetical protein